jgi:hypothetical protein
MDQSPFSDVTKGRRPRSSRGSSQSAVLRRNNVMEHPNADHSVKSGKEKSLDRSHDSSSASHTFLSRLHQDEVSFSEAIDRYTTPTIHFPTIMDHPQDEKIILGEIDIFCGDRAWWKPKMILSAWNNLVHVSDIDDEMIALLRIALSASGQGFLNGLFNLLDVSLIGYLVGTKEASIFVLVSTLTWLPTTLTYGFFEALAKLIPPTMDQINQKLAGLFLLMAVMSFTFAMLLIGLFWSFTMKMTFIRIGFDESTASLAEQYAYVQIAFEWISGIGYCLHLLLDISGHERYSSFSNLIFGLGQTTAVVFQSLFGTKSLLYVGLCRALFAALHVLGSTFLVVWKGWLDHYKFCMAAIPFPVRKNDDVGDY